MHLPVFVLVGLVSLGAQSAPIPTLDEAVASKFDLWGEAAMGQSNGPSYEFFKPLIPPLHYVNADFHHYPIVLSSPATTVKARLVSNGSAINARANTRAWSDTGTPVQFRVGNDELAFGEYPDRLHGPKFVEGYLPAVLLEYQHGDGVYSQETFGSTQPPYASNAVVLSRFAYQPNEKPDRPEKGRMVVRVESGESLKAESGRVLNEKGEVLLWFDENWKWVPARRLLEASFTERTKAAVAVTTIPMPAEVLSPLDGNSFEVQRQHCLQTWQTLLQRGMNVVVPEPYVNNAWRALVIANFALMHGDRMHYSAGNQYDKLYEHEGSDTAQAMMLWGYESDFRRLLVPLLDFTRKGLEYHQAGHKLDDVCRYYWQTRDGEFVRSLRVRWQKEVDLLANNRSPTNGLYPREQYCGDIATPVFSMNSNAKGWRALRDVAALVSALGDKPEAERLRGIARTFRGDILAALKQSTRMDVRPAFIPNALLGEEQPYDFIPATRMGNYWNVMANTVIGTEIFGVNAELETGMLQYCQQHAGLFMGLLRSHPWPSFWVSSDNLNPLYTQRYALTLLRRDEPERALVSFYGMLAAGMTPDTFIGGEGCSIQPVDSWGRQFYCPPNSAGNAFWLHMLRRLLVQDWDLDENGEPETLRLLFATPKRWLEDGKTIIIERAPTAFGPISMRVASHLSQGEVIADLDLPTRNPPAKVFFRARVPEGWKVLSASAGSEALQVDQDGAAEISSLKGKVSLRLRVTRGRN